MERNEITTVEFLKPGDRFYKKADKKKKPMQMVLSDSKQTQFRTYKFFCCATDIIDNKLMTENLKKRQYQPILKDTVVVYLRNANEPVN